MSVQTSLIDNSKKKNVKFGAMCHYCNKIYSSEGYLSRHLKTKHPVSDQQEEDKYVDLNDSKINISCPYKCALDLGVNICNEKAMELVFSKFNTKVNGIKLNGESYDIDISYSYNHKKIEIGPCSQDDFYSQFAQILKNNRPKITDDEIKNIIEYCQNSSGHSYTINGSINQRMICDSINHKGWIHKCYTAFTIVNLNQPKLPKLDTLNSL